MSVDLYNYNDAEYIGDIYLGLPSQRASVVLDSGSSWLNIKACMANMNCHQHTYEIAGKPEAKDGDPSHLPHYKEIIMKDPDNKHGIVYYPNKTTTGLEVDRNHNFQLSYGSADLEGWKF